MDDPIPAHSIDDSKLSGEPPSLSRSNGAQLTPEELVAKAIAPVKREYLRPPPARSSCNNVKDSVSVSEKNEIDNKGSQSSLVKEKKSKRQLKRERRQEQKSTGHLCPEIAKTGDVNSCRYKDKCRFSHDIEAFKSQKPADLDGECPFNSAEQFCPYGLGCRFAGTHKESVSHDSSNALKKISEVNGLKKDVQKLLWKNKMKFPKADSKLKELGLLGHGKSKSRAKEDKEDDQIVSNDSVVLDKTCCSEVNSEPDAQFETTVEVPEENGVEETPSFDESQPLKKPKPTILDKCNSDQIDNGDACMTENASGENHTQIEPEHENDSVLLETDGSLKSHPREKKLIDFRDKLYLAPLTTVGNLPFRRMCKVLGADVTCGEMAMCTNLLQGQASEWALLRRHSSEDLFGVQICGAYPDTVTRAVELIDNECVLDFIDINMGCPIDIVVNKGAGSALLTKPMRMKSVVELASGIVDTPVTIKVRTGYFEGKNRIDSLIADIGNWGASAVTIHGRSRQQRYSKLADWEYINRCSTIAPDSLQVIGNGDVFSYSDWCRHKDECPKLATCMIARGALIKPWIFTEIKEQRNWDISSGERLDILKDFTRFGLEHWGSDTKGVETTRHFLLEWLSYTYRYVPVGLLEVVPQRLNWRPPSYFGRDDLETLMASDSAADWIRITEMLLGKVPEGFSFAPKHKSNAYDRPENG